MGDNEGTHGSDLDALTAESRAIWDENAAYWDARMGAEGNDWQRDLIRPPTERLLALRPGELVLDVACGNGAFSRRMAALGARVVAFDFSARLVELARARTAASPDLAGSVEYRVLDATDEAALLALGAGRFDAAVATMALMDMPAIEPLFAALARLLKPGGRFVFSVSHPCFHSMACRMAIEQEERGGELVTTRAVKVSGYLRQSPTKGVAIVGQPALQYYFDRPLSVLLGAGFRAGFALDGLEEPSFDGGPEPARPFSWANFPDIPPALVARMRVG
ncbi:MAG TPA: class I SAM-dependent methyltransferase [Thermomicrobiales bacterium]|nr:class I SAM-dependent methyltransferase [Thermomicrobiales bacterium]